jgi:hypothetical protein
MSIVVQNFRTKRCYIGMIMNKCVRSDRLKEKLCITTCGKPTKKEMDNTVSLGTGLWSKKKKNQKIVEWFFYFPCELILMDFFERRL